MDCFFGIDDALAVVLMETGDWNIPGISFVVGRTGSSYHLPGQMGSFEIMHDPFIRTNNPIILY